MISKKSYIMNVVKTSCKPIKRSMENWLLIVCSYYLWLTDGQTAIIIIIDIYMLTTVTSTLQH